MKTHATAAPAGDLQGRSRPGLQGRALLVLALVLAAAAPRAEARLSAFVSILPQACIVERIGGGFVAVHVLVGPGQSPHAYDPTPRQVAALSGADVFFTIGMPFERRLLGKIRGLGRGMTLVDMRRGIRLRPADDHGGAGHGGAHAGADPHVWLSPLLLKRQAATVCRALRQKDPGNGAAYRRNYENLAADLDRLHAELSRRLAPLAGRQVFVFHPALGYFADAYGLRQVPIEMEGKEPGSRSFAAILDRARAAGTKTIFVERQFSPKSARAVAARIGAEVVTIDPLAPDCLQNLRDIAAKIEKMR